MISTVFLILGLNALCTRSSLGAPAQDPKTLWDPNVLSPVLSTCTPGGRCWRWLSVPEIHDDSYVVPEESNAPRLLTRRQITPDSSDTTLTMWNGSGPLPESAEMPFSIDKRTPHKLSKKVFTSQGWGAGGLPFSVLYMIPPNTLSNHANSNVAGHGQQSEQGRLLPRPQPTNSHSNDHISLRNGQTRRSYPSIIPQLFISHGWGPLGK